DLERAGGDGGVAAVGVDAGQDQGAVGGLREADRAVVDLVDVLEGAGGEDERVDAGRAADLVIEHVERCAVEVEGGGMIGGAGGEDLDDVAVDADRAAV